MQRLVAHKLVVGLLTLSAAMLLLVALDLFSAADLASSAMAQVPPVRPSAPPSVPASPSSRLVILPGQLSSTTWGCYVFDPDTRTLCVYQYLPGEKILKLQAARMIQQDLNLRSFNTSPQPSEIEDWLQKEKSGQSRPTTSPAGDLMLNR